MVRIKTVIREATTKSLNVTQPCLAPEISGRSSVCQYLPLSVNEVEFSKVTSSSLVVEGRSEVTGAVLGVKVVCWVVVGVVCDAQLGR